MLANKKDLRDAMTASELTTALALTDVKVLQSNCRTYACPCTALSAAALTHAAQSSLVHSNASSQFAEADCKAVVLQVDWHMQATCATTGEGLREGLDWIAQRLQGDKAAPRRVMR